MREEDQDVLEAKLSRSEGALLEEIGASLYETQGFDLKTISADELRRRAERWIEIRHATFVQKICKEWNFSERVKDPRYQDKVFLAGAVADLIAGLVTKVAPFTVAAYLVKRGLEKLCG